MAETTRELVVRLTMDAGGFKKTANEINTQIRNIDREIKSMGDDKSGKKSKLEEKLDLQKTAVDNLKSAVDQAKTKLAEATTEKDKLLAAKQLSGLETSLETAENRAKSLADELRSINLMNFGSMATNFGNAMKRMGRSFSLYVGAPLAALGLSSMNVFKEYEMAATLLETKLDGTAEDLERLTNAALEMSETIPVSFTEIVAIMTSLAAAGVPTEKIEGMTLALAQMSAVTGMSADEVGTSMVLFMNAMNEPFENIDQLGAALVELADKSIATETDIFSMATRMAATGGLAGLSAVDVFSLAAAFASMGVNAEAGGTAASKLMKKMQLATETGTTAMEAFSKESMTAGMSVRDIQLAADDTKWVTALAGEMEMTKEETKGMIDSMVSLQQYADVMNTTIAGFSAMWEQSPADAMLNFFQGLSDLGSSGNEQSVLNILDQMGMTEVRLSNLIALGAQNPDMFKDLLNIGDTGFEENTALVEKSGKIFETTSGQLDVLTNQIKNTQADLGENVADALTPVLEVVTDLVSKFSELDEDTQTRWVKIGGALIALGPMASAIGNVAKGVGGIATWAGKLTASGVLNWQNLGSALGSLAANPMLLIGAAGLVTAIALSADRIGPALNNIQITIDEDSVQKALDEIAAVQAAADKLSGAEFDSTYAGVSTAVAAGYGTEAMFGQALAYEKIVAERQIAEISGAYGQQISNLNAAIVDAVNAGTPGVADALEGQREAVQADWDAAVLSIQGDYSGAINKLFDGMLGKNKEEAARAEKIGQEYDLFSKLHEALWEPGTTVDQWKEIFTPEMVAAYFPDAGDYENWIAGIESQGMFDTFATGLYERLRQSMTEDISETAEDGLAYTLLKTMLDADSFNLADFTQFQGALDGIIEGLDFKAAEGQGENLTQGLADGASRVAPEKMGESMNTVRDATIAAIQAAFQMHSPSQLMAMYGQDITAGIAVGIIQGIPQASAAMSTLGSTLAAQAAQMASLISSAFNANISFNIPNPGGVGPAKPGGPAIYNNTITVTGSATAQTGIYGIQRGLTDAIKRVNRGYGNG